MNPYIDNEGYWCQNVEVSEMGSLEPIGIKVIRYKVNTKTGLFEEVTE